jgi:hypothetical protein
VVLELAKGDPGLSKADSGEVNLGDHRERKNAGPLLPNARETTNNGQQ